LRQSPGGRTHRGGRNALLGRDNDWG
jgi:hypothetical protein